MIALVTEKAPDSAKAYPTWILALAHKVAEAAKEGTRPRYRRGAHQPRGGGLPGARRPHAPPPAPAARLTNGAPRALGLGRRMDLLVLGGTRFVGKHAVEAALARGHTSRWCTAPPPTCSPTPSTCCSTAPPARTRWRRWPAGPSTGCSTSAATCRGSSATPAGRWPGRWATRRSSPPSRPTPRRSATTSPTHPLWPVGGLRDEGASEEITNESYGPLKVACEEEFLEHFPTRLDHPADLRGRTGRLHRPVRLLGAAMSRRAATSSLPIRPTRPCS